jgi:hypothetical protein
VKRGAKTIPSLTGANSLSNSGALRPTLSARLATTAARYSIRRHDWKPVSDWRDKQTIKNQIVGPEWEAAELYPAESRVQDEGNWFHLWVMPRGGRYSFGFIEQETERSDKPAKPHEVQRPLAQRGDDGPLIQATPFIAMPCRAHTRENRRIAATSRVPKCA